MARREPLSFCNGSLIFHTAFIRGRYYAVDEETGQLGLPLARENVYCVGKWITLLPGGEVHILDEATGFGSVRHLKEYDTLTYDGNCARIEQRPYLDLSLLLASAYSASYDLPFWDQ